MYPPHNMPSGERWLRVAELVGELAELSVVDLDETVDHLLCRACEIVGVNDAMLGFARRDPRLAAGDPLRGWRPPSPYRPRRFGPHAEGDAVLLDNWYGSIRDLALDPATGVLARSSGCVRAVLQRDVMAPRAWERASIFELLDASRISDRLIGGRPVADDVEMLLVMYRHCSEPRFGEDERQCLEMLMAALAGVGRRIALAHGFIDARRPLTRRERETLHHLLAGRSEKQIAAAMDLSERTLHHRVTALFHKFDVQSRAELMALFLRSTSTSDCGRVLVVPPSISPLALERAAVPGEG
jgi:DNA-binding CsgD family transcriptional regulator